MHRNPVQATENKDSANQPINVESDSGFSFPCPLCRNEFTSEKSLREHTNTTHDNNELDCNDCDFNTDNENILQTHIEEVHTFQCNMCNYSAKTKGWLTRHINTSHQTISRIDSYDEPHQPELTDNSRIDATNNIPFSCDICDWESDNEEEIRTHKQTVHQEANTAIEHTTTRRTGPKQPPPSWTCLDQHGKVHGPFSWDKMLRWYNSGGINPRNMLKRDGDDNFAYFEDIQKIYGQQPFSVCEPLN